MADTARTRFVTALVLALVFTTGLIVGLAVDRDVVADEAPVEGVMAASGAAADSTREAGTDDRRERRRPMYEQVGLDEGQEARIDSIVRHFREESEAARKEARREWDARWWDMVLETREAIKSVMGPEQALRYDSLLQAESDRRDDDRRRGDDAGN